MPSRRRALSRLAFVIGYLVVNSPLGAINILFDYSFDSGDFFSGTNVERRLTLEAAASAFTSRIEDNFPPSHPVASIVGR